MLFLTTSIPAVSAIDAYIGDTVDLGGGATADYVYLFITGPNLPPNGANPEDIDEEVVTGSPSSFVRATVINNRWSYKWDTRTAGGTPDPGTYVFYAVDKPAGRYDLSGTEYSAVSVVLKDPSISSASVGTSGAGESPYVVVEETETSSTDKEAGNAYPEETTVAVYTEQTPLRTPDDTPTPTPTPTPAAGVPLFILLISMIAAIMWVSLRK